MTHRQYRRISGVRPAIVRETWAAHCIPGMVWTHDYRRKLMRNCPIWQILWFWVNWIRLALRKIFCIFVHILKAFSILQNSNFPRSSQFQPNKIYNSTSKLAAFFLFYLILISIFGLSFWFCCLFYLSFCLFYRFVVQSIGQYCYVYHSIELLSIIACKFKHIVYLWLWKRLSKA